MPSFDLLLPFFVATTIFACVPGPGMLYAAAQTVARGRRAGWLAAVGFHLAGYAHIGAAAGGLAVLLETLPLVYGAIKLAGAGYLIWLGIVLIRSGQTAPGSSRKGEPPPTRQTISESLAVEILNPKTALFHLAFLPQFTDATAALPVATQILILGAIVNAVFSLTDIACVLLSAWLTRSFRRSPTAHRAARWLGGGVLVGLGVNLAGSRA